ncbi:hypothetical protein, partial [Streptomyces sp. NPDC088184]|uniref:hypothetical protein n=1 Tax=Streptomyces sp. NPDC088184 TaxID=3160991 RepID=UPI0034207EC7
MKQSAVRTLGVAALGAAFAAAAAGTASAAVLPTDVANTALPVAGAALETATQSLPVQETATKLLGTGQQKLRRLAARAGRRAARHPRSREHALEGRGGAGRR